MASYCGETGPGTILEMQRAQAMVLAMHCCMKQLELATALGVAQVQGKELLLHSNKMGQETVLGSSPTELARVHRGRNHDQRGLVMVHRGQNQLSDGDVMSTRHPP